MPHYRKKPIVIEAVQWLGDNASEVLDFCCSEREEKQIGYNQTEESFTIPTLEGIMRANKGDYIIKGVQGEYYPCKKDIFKASYDLVEE
jgi:hypothetical protein